MSRNLLILLVLVLLAGAVVAYSSYGRRPSAPPRTIAVPKVKLLADQTCPNCGRAFKLEGAERFTGHGGRPMTRCPGCGQRFPVAAEVAPAPKGK